MRRLTATAAAIAALLLPGLSSAQVTSVFGRTGAVTAMANDYTCAKVTNCASTASGVANTFTGVQTINTGGNPTPGFKNDTVLGLVTADGHYTSIDIIAITGSSSSSGSYGGIQTEAYGCSTGSLCAVPNQQITAAYSSAAYNGMGSDPTDASVLMRATETQTTTHNGMDVEFWYTPNGSTAFTQGAALSQGGSGGFTVGSSSVSDLGSGTIDAAGSIATGNHFRSRGSAPTLSTCGTGSTVTGTDAAGEVINGSSITSCTVTFASAYSSAPVCIVQDYSNATPTIYLTSFTTTGFKATWSANYNGVWFYICMDKS